MKGEQTLAGRAEVGLGLFSVVVSKSCAATTGYTKGKDRVFCLDVATGRIRAMVRIEKARTRFRAGAQNI